MCVHVCVIAVVTSVIYYLFAFQISAKPVHLPPTLNTGIYIHIIMYICLCVYMCVSNEYS